MSTPTPTPDPEPSPEQLEAQAKQLQIFNLGCILLLFGPFLLLGLVTLLLAYLNWDTLDVVGKIVSAVLGLLFTAVGGLPLFASQLKKNWIVGRLRLGNKFPGQPWMWREDWRGGVLDDVSSAGLIWHWMGAATVTIVIGVLAYQRDHMVAYRYFAENYPTPTRLLAALTLAVPVFIIGRAIHATLRARKFGRSKFVMVSVPCRLGGRLAGRVETTMHEVPREGVWVILKCNRLTRSSMSGRRGSKEYVKEIWSNRQEVAAHHLERGADGMKAPVDFEIPSDAEPTGRVRMGLRHEWRLTVRADIPGVDYRADFVVPVFRLNAQGRIDDDHPNPT